MTWLYEMLDISPQAFSKAKKRMLGQDLIEAEILKRCSKERLKHKQMGCRKLYDQCLSDMPIGRDKCEAILLKSGFRVKYPKNWIKTTRSVKAGYFPNLIKGIEIDGPDQLWQSDITYVWETDKFYYAVFIIDVYTKMIVGAAIGENMKSSLILKALQKAFKCRNGKDLTGLIFHSDRGSQYVESTVKKTLAEKGIIQSMCLEAWENAYAERINGTIKNEYLRYFKSKNLREITRYLAASVKLYNEDRIHLGLPRKMTPSEFEKSFILLSSQQRPKLRLYTEEEVFTRGIEPQVKTANKEPL